jgi:hypothetical protein
MVKRSGEFYGKPIKSGEKKRIIIIPQEFHKDMDKVLNKMLKFTWEEIVDSGSNK